MEEEVIDLILNIVLGDILKKNIITEDNDGGISVMLCVVNWHCCLLY